MAGLLAPRHTPGYALDNTGVYKLEIGLVFFIAVYAVGLVLHLAYQGRSLGQLSLGVVQGSLPDPNPDATGLDTDPGLSEAKTGFAEFEKSTKDRLDTHDENFSVIDRKLDSLEAAVRKP